MTACLEVRTKIVLFVEGRSTHSSRREENPYGAQVFRYETGQQERSERCWKRGKRRRFLDMKMVKLPIVKEGREEYWNRHVKWDGRLALELAPYHDSSFAARCSKCFLRNHPRAARLRARTSYPCVLTRQIHTSGSLGLRHCKLACPFRPSVRGGKSASNLLFAQEN